MAVALGLVPLVCKRELSLQRALRFAFDRLTPRIRARGPFLDLRAHGGQDDTDGDAQISFLCRFLIDQLGLPTSLPIVETAPLADVGLRRRCEELQVRHERHPSVGSAPGVARWLQPLARGLDVHPKTLANSWSRGPDPSRRDHRWLIWLLRTSISAEHPDLWCFHERTTEALVARLGRWQSDYLPDAVDALLLHSLVALWQRRRPKHRVRAHRGQAVSRRDLAKPLASLDDWLISAAMVRGLTTLLTDIHLAESAGASASPWLGVLVEAALSQAHMAMHPSSRTGDRRTGQRYFSAAERAMQRLDQDAPRAAALLRWRVAWMGQWRVRSGETPPVSAALAQHPYVVWSRFLAATRQTTAGRDVIPWPALPAPLMLRPQIRAKPQRSTP